MSKLYNNIRLIDLIDTSTQPIDALYAEMTNNLLPLKDSAYPVNDDNLFNDFIQRLCDRYFNRYLSFETYYTFYTKLKFVLEDNREKYLRIYEASLKKINPLITFEENEEIKENRDSNGNNTSNSTSNSDTTTNGNSTSNHNETRTDNTKTSFNNVSDDQKTLSAHSSNPKSQSSISMDPDKMNYIDSENLTIAKDNYHNTTSNTGTVTNSGTDTGHTSSDAHSNATNNSSSNYTDKINSAVERIKSGFNGNQLELLKLYTTYYFDVNKEIINDIERARLFMSTLA